MLKEQGSRSDEAEDHALRLNAEMTEDRNQHRPSLYTYNDSLNQSMSEMKSVNTRLGKFLKNKYELYDSP